MNKFSERLEDSPFLIMSHRGFWGGNVIENTVESAYLAYKAGADIVEVDICKTSDGIYYLFHDGNEPKLLNKQVNFKLLSSEDIEDGQVYNSIGTPSGYHINRLDAFLEWLPENKLVNIDRSWDCWNEKDFFKIIEKSGKQNQLVFKSPVMKEHLDFFSKNGRDLYYIPIVKTREEFDLVMSYNDINTIGVELVTTTLESELLDKKWISMVQSMGLFTVANSENLGSGFKLFAGLNDDTILFNDEDDWESILDTGIQVIQTDWPNFLNDYRSKLEKVGD